VVRHSLARLDQVKAALDRVRAATGTSWAVDVQSNAVVVDVPRPGAGSGTATLLAKARSFGSAVRVARTAGAVSTQAFFGGQAILTGGSRCSAGFITRVPASGNQYVVTAGHCTNIGTNWTTSSGQTIGATAASRFPGDDFGAIRIANPAALQPQDGVLNNGAFQDITGSTRVAVNATVCKTGSTTGTTCGRVLQYNTTVNYPQGTVFGLTTTNVCTQPGDSGGSLFAGTQAQGVTSGGTVGSCSQAGFRSFLPTSGRDPARLRAAARLTRGRGAARPFRPEAPRSGGLKPEWPTSGSKTGREGLVGRGPAQPVPHRALATIRLLRV